MGRPGAGSGGRSSGGGHSHSRSSGGHRTSSSRPRTSSSHRTSSSGSFNFGSSHHTSHTYHTHHHYDYGPSDYGYTPRTRGPRRPGVAIAVFCIILFIVMISPMFTVWLGFTSNGSGSSDAVKSTIQRSKIETGNAFVNDCVIDEIGWFANTSKVSAGLKKFWEKTGVQPIVLFRDYDPTLVSDSAKTEWAEDYYDENVDIENAFLFVYFGEEDIEGEMGYMAYANGYQTSAVMDSEAMEIFWGKIDYYWATDLSMDDVIIRAFQDTGDTIMRVSTTSLDVLKYVVIAIIIVIVFVIVFTTVKTKRKHDRERAEETERILNTPIDKL